MSNPAESTPQCLYCKRSSQVVPLVALCYGDDELWICPQHLPILIHQPQDLIDKLPGAANLDAPEGHDH
jgi:hypothetical protein